MSTGAVKRLTTNFGLNIINYDFPRWHTYEWQNWDVLDAVLAAANLTSVKGAWVNSAAYLIGDRVVDTTDNTIWLCAVAHTSAASGTFSADRTANPTYWSIVSSVPVYRGSWLTLTNYSTQDIVKNGNGYYLCSAAHTSGTFSTDLAANKWALIIDLSDAIGAQASATASASAAATSESAAAGSASAASTSASNAASSASTASTAASNASSSQTAAANSASAAATSESNAATSASNAATSASTATTQAGIATTKAEEAAASAATVNFSAVAADVIPDTNNSRDLGNTSKAWNDVFATNVRADNFGNRAGTSSIPADTLLQGTAKAWLNLNGIGTIAARDSFNISSLIDNSTGNYTYNFSVARPNINFSVSCSSGDIGANYLTSNVGTNNSVSSYQTLSVDVNIPAVTDIGYIASTISGDP